MNKKSIIFLVFAGLLAFFTSCEKDGDKIPMLTSPVSPSLSTLPDLALTRTNGNNILEFKGTPVNPGFNASANYFLEASKSGTSFADPLVLVSSVQDTVIKISVSDLNAALLKKFPADQISLVDFRIRSVLVVDAGTGAVGTSSSPLVYISEVKTADVSVYGLPRLNVLANDVIIGKIESALGNGLYTGFVKLDNSKPFTLKDPDTNVLYGANGAALKENGTAINAPASGWHKVTISTADLTYKMDAYMIGLVGSATANGWDSPDQKMDYDATTGTWSITTNLKAGDIKFRLNDGWAWNMGGTPDKLTHDGANIPVTAGNYTITLTITNPTQGSETGTYKIVKKN